MKEIYTFGIVAAGRRPRDKKRLQAIQVEREKISGPVLQYRLSPQWEQPLPDQFYIVTTPSRCLEMQHIRGNVDEIFEGLFEEGKDYVDRYGDTD